MPEMMEAVLIIVGSYAANVLYALNTRRHVRTYFERVQSPELAMHRLERLSGIPQIVLMMAGVILSSMQIIPFLEEGILSDMIIVLSPLALLMAVMLTTVVVNHTLECEIRNITETKRERVVRTLRMTALLYSPVLIIYLLRTLLPEEFVDRLLDGEMSGLLIPMSLLAAVFLLQPLFLQWSLKAKVMPDSELRQRLETFTKKVGIKNYELYVWPTTKERNANVLVSGYFKTKVYFADYLLANCTDAEAESILAHEFGHIKHYHLWLKLGFSLLWYPFIQLVAYLGDTYAPDAPEWIIYLVLTLCAVLYLGFLYLYISRYQEKQADAYVMKLGVDVDVFVSSLHLLARLNNTVMYHNKAEEALQTHPSIARRVAWVSGGKSLSRKELKEGFKNEL